MKHFENRSKTEYNPDMSQKEKRISDQAMMSGVGYLAILAVTILGIQLLDEGLPRVVGIILLLAFAILFTLMPGRTAPTWKSHLFLGLMTAIIAGLLVLQPNWGVFPMLFFVLSPSVMMIFPQKIGFRWIIIFTVVTGVVFFAMSDLGTALITLLPFSAGYWFFGAFARAMKTSEEAQLESQRLLAELQTAHTQLQNYAARVEELAISEERNRLAREMHDTLGHRLTVASVQLEGAQRLIENDPGRAAGMVETVRDQVREALNELRATVATLREPLVTDLTLTASLKRLAESFEQATDLTLHLDLPEDLCPLPHAYRLALYRAAQEALTNVQRHAQAHNIWLTLKPVEGGVEMTINDDGVGFPIETREAAFGLRGMRERIAHLNGELQLGGRDGGGAQIRITLPLLEKNKDA